MVGQPRVRCDQGTRGHLLSSEGTGQKDRDGHIAVFPGILAIPPSAPRENGPKHRQTYPTSASRQRLMDCKHAALQHVRDACARAEPTDRHIAAEIRADQATRSRQVPKRPPSVVPDLSGPQLRESNVVQAGPRSRRTNLPPQKRTHERRLERRTAGALASEASPSKRPLTRRNAVPCCVMRCWTSGVPATAPIQ